MTALRGAWALGTKHIPIAYLRASAPQRLELLRGLMDTDGFSIRGGQVGLDLTCERLARDAAELVRTFGWKTRLAKRTATLYGVVTGPKYRMSWRPDRVCFHLPRKVDAWQPATSQASRSTIRTVASVEPVASVPTRCIAVDSPRHLYLAGESFIPTHNTAFDAWLVLWYLDTHTGNVRVPCAAPTEDQLVDMLWPEMKVWLDRAPELRDRIVWKGSRVGVKGYERTAFALQRAAGPDKRPDNLAGFHADFLLYLVDEASGVADHNMTVISGALSTEGAQIVMTGNPTRASGYFANRFVTERDTWYVDTVSSWAPRAPPTSTPGPSLTSGARSPTSTASGCGPAPTGRGTRVFPGHLVEECQERPADPSGQLIVGVDVARYGRDRTAFACRRGTTVFGLKTYSKLSNPTVCNHLMDYIEGTALSGESVTIIVDDGGVGGGVTDLLKVMQRDGTTRVNFRVFGVTFGGQGDQWYSTNAGVYWHRMRKAAQEKWLVLPKDPTLYSQLTDRTSTVNTKGKTVIEPKEHMRERGVRSPDVADAVSLCFAQGGQGHAFMEMWAKEIELQQSPHPQDGPLNRSRMADVTVFPARHRACKHRWWATGASCAGTQSRRPEDDVALPSLSERGRAGSKTRRWPRLSRS